MASAFTSTNHFNANKSSIGLILSAAMVVLFLNIGLFSTALPVGKASKCSVCTDADRARCPVVIPGPDCEVIDEPNCGCCKMCAKKLGEKCGVATGLCETGLECIPPPMTQEEYDQYGPADYLTEILLGNFICVTKQQFLDILSGVAYEDETAGEDNLYVPELYDPLTGLTIPEDDDEEFESDGSDNGEKHEEDTIHLNTIVPSLEPVAVTARPSEPPAAPYQNAVEPCAYHAEIVWRKPHFGHHEWVPGCSEEGYYVKQQCELSYGLERGRCWCVDRLGNPTSGFTPGEEINACSR